MQVESSVLWKEMIEHGRRKTESNKFKLHPKTCSGPVTKNYKRKFLRRKNGVPVMCETIEYKAREHATHTICSIILWPAQVGVWKRTGSFFA
jgi:ribosomal protein L36